MRRREFIALLGGAAAWPLWRARAQQPAMPVIGFLDTTRLTHTRIACAHFAEGLKEAGYVEGENVTIEYRWADNQIDRLPALAADLVRRRVAVIVATGGRPRHSRLRRQPRRFPSSSSSAKTRSELGLVTSLARPGGNVTGINFFTVELAAKRLELLRELVPGATRVAVLVNPRNAANTEATVRDVEVGCPRHRITNPGFQRQHQPRDRCSLRDFACASGPTPFSSARSLLHQPARPTGTVAARHGIPAIYSGREFAEAGGLMSYGSALTDAYRQVGVLCRPHPQGREAGGPAGRAGD